MVDENAQAIADTPAQDPAVTQDAPQDTQQELPGMATQMSAPSPSEDVQSEPVTDTPAAEGEVSGWQKRYRDLQSHADKRVSQTEQENSALREQLEALNAKIEALAPQALPETPDPTASLEKYAKIAEEEGQIAALAALQKDSVELAKREVMSVTEQQYAERNRQAMEQAEIDTILGQFGMPDGLDSRIGSVIKQENGRGYSLSPGASYALAMAQGDWSVAIGLMREGMQALEARNAPAEAGLQPHQTVGSNAPQQHPVHPGLPGRGGSPAPAAPARPHSLSSHQAFDLIGEWMK